MQLCFVGVDELSVANLLEVSKFAVEILPTVELDALVSVSLEDLDGSVGEFDHHADVVVFAVCHKSLDGALGVRGLHEQKISRFALLEELLFEESVHDGVDLVAVFSEFDFGRIYKRLYDLMNVINPLTRDIDGLASKGVLGLFLGVNEVEGESQVILGLDEAIDLTKVEATDKLCPTFIFKAEQLLGREHTETGLDRGINTIQGLRNESLSF